MKEWEITMYQLYIANKNYSSWSLRPWILMKELDIAFEERLQPFESEDSFAAFRQFSPSGTVPCLIDDDRVIWDSLAIIEYLAERSVGVWPVDESARTFARCAAAEMHSSFTALRHICPMNCAITVEMAEIPAKLQRDIDRVDELWREGLDRFGGPYLAGDTFTAADAFYCPVAYRIRSYQLPVSAEALTYGERLLALPGMVDWDAAAVAEPWIEAAHEEEARAAGEITRDRRNS
jgi:glutathione S-transferase